MAKAALRGAENFRYFADRVTEARDGKSMRAKGLYKRLSDLKTKVELEGFAAELIDSVYSVTLKPISFQNKIDSSTLLLKQLK